MLYVSTLFCVRIHSGSLMFDPVHFSPSGEVIETGHSGAIHDAQLDYYGKLLATASSDNTVPTRHR